MFKPPIVTIAPDNQSVNFSQFMAFPSFLKIRISRAGLACSDLSHNFSATMNRPVIKAVALNKTRMAESVPEL